MHVEQSSRQSGPSSEGSTLGKSVCMGTLAKPDGGPGEGVALLEDTKDFPRWYKAEADIGG